MVNWLGLLGGFAVKAVEFAIAAASGKQDAEQAFRQLIQEGYQIVTEASDKAADEARAHLPDGD